VCHARGVSPSPLQAVRRPHRRGGRYCEMANTGPLTRRDLLRIAATGGVAAAVGLNWAEGGPRAAAAIPPIRPSTPDESLAELVAGNIPYYTSIGGANHMISFTEDVEEI